MVALGFAVLVPGLAQAYMGPGAGLSAIGSVLAFLGVVALLVAGFVWYPVKRMVRGWKTRGTAEDSDSGAGPGV